MPYLDTIDPAKVETALARFTAQCPERIAEVDGDAKFALWLFLVDVRVTRAIGLSYSDLPDYAFRACYDDGMTPREVATDLLEENGF